VRPLAVRPLAVRPLAVFPLGAGLRPLLVGPLFFWPERAVVLRPVLLLVARGDRLVEPPRLPGPVRGRGLSSSSGPGACKAASA